MPPLGPDYAINRRALLRADPEAVEWFLRFIARRLPANTIDFILLFGNRAYEGDQANEARTLGMHQFMVVVRDEAPDEVLTGNASWRAMVADMQIEAAHGHAPYVNLFICRRTPWDDHLDVDAFADARRGIQFVERLGWI